MDMFQALQINWTYLIFLYYDIHAYYHAETLASMTQLLHRETSCFEPPRSGLTGFRFPVKVKL